MGSVVGVVFVAVSFFTRLIALNYILVPILKPSRYDMRDHHGAETVMP